jgi:hypothetical protein
MGNTAWVSRVVLHYLVVLPVTHYTVSVLCGGRSGLLQRMLKSVDPEIAESSERMFYVWDPFHEKWDRAILGEHEVTSIRGGSAERKREFNLVKRPKKGVATHVAQSTGLLLSAAASHGLPILHLEDDWECHRDEQPGWLELALNVLHMHEHVGQVRLRSVREYLERRNTFTRGPIEWLIRDGYRVSMGAAQCNFPPALWNPKAIRGCFPAETEHEAGIKFAAAGWRIAQLWPGVFYHTGQDACLVPGHDAARHEASIRNHRVPEDEI